MKHISDILSNKGYLKYSIPLDCVYKGYLIKPLLKFNSSGKSYFDIGIFDINNFYRCVYCGKFSSINQCFKFINLHYSDFKKWTIL